MGATLLHHLSKYDQRKSAVAALKDDRFVDDLVTGADDEGVAAELSEHAVRICAEGGFPLRKFATNSVAVRSRLQQLQPHGASLVLEGGIGHSNVLGLEWRWSEDDLAIEVDSIMELYKATEHIRTKRMMLRTSMKLYDVMGLIAPVSTPPEGTRRGGAAHEVR